MEQAQKNLTDVRFEFVQRVRQGDFPEQRVAGEVFVKRPGLLRVVQKTPEKQVLISDGTTFWLYAPAQKQQLKGDWKAWLKQSGFPLPLIDFVGTFTPELWRSQYKVMFGGYQEPLYELRFEPLHGGVMPLTLWISEESFLPARGRLQDPGVSVEVLLKGMQPNTELKPSLFVPRVPEGTEEIPVTF